MSSHPTASLSRGRVAGSSEAYRPEIDGLRAVAVLSVIFFHAEIPPFFGGFVGVDVFFVISGFLITGILLRDIDSGRPWLAAFYARRARRIVPALVFVGLACVPAAIAFMGERQLHDFFATLATAAVAGSNFWLAATSGYFDAAAHERPLLHTWSLGVEEQFYLLFPLLLIGTRRWQRRHVGWLLALAALASLALAQWSWPRHANANFYLAPGRAWELLAGCIAALATHGHDGPPKLPHRLREMLALAGLMLLLPTFFLLDRDTPSPSLALAQPVAGSVLLVLFARSDTLVGRLLALKPLVALGLVSYSAYLWHQPLLAFARLNLDGPLTPQWQAGLVAATFVLAALSWKWVEQPFRSGQRFGTRRALRLGGAACASMAAIAVAGHLLTERFVPPMPVTVTQAFEPPRRAKQCFDIPYAHAKRTDWFCGIHPSGEPRPSFALFGDSHALQVLEVFESAARQTGRTGVFAGFSGCAPLLAVVQLSRPNAVKFNCRELNERMLAYVKKAGIRDVFLVAKWSYATDSFEAEGTPYLNALGLGEYDQKTVASSRRAFAHGVAMTVRAYQAAGARLHFVKQVPQQQRPPAAIYERVWRRPERAEEILAGLSVPLRRHLQLQEYPDATLRRYAVPPHEVLNFDDLFCDATSCLVGTPAQPYYMDVSHLSAAGAQRLESRLVEAMRRPPAP